MVVLAATGAAGGAAGNRSPEELWRSAFDARPAVDLGGRMVVVLAAPSLADRVAATGRLPAPKVQQRIVRRAEAFQRRLLAALRAGGVRIFRERSFTRTFNGFSAVLDARALAALERAPGVVGVYPVRAVYPASVSADVLDSPEFGPAGGHRPGVSLPGRDGAGVTIALLDTGVDRTHPALHGRVARGIDLVDGRGAADQPESHGTRIAGLLVGSDPVAGVAPGARVLPIRVLAPVLSSGVLGYAGRSDVLLDGIERAVDPNADGDVSDAARIALAALVEPYASFTDSPEARAVAGATRLGTLVVAAAGNDGPAGAGFGTIGAPGGAPGALTVGAVDTRLETLSVDVTVSVAGGEVWRGRGRLLNGVPPEGDGSASNRVDVVPADGAPLAPRIRAAASAGATAVLVYGSGLPAGSLDLEDRAALPVVALPLRAGERVARAIDRGRQVSVEFGEATTLPNPAAGEVAPFSSQGPALGGHAKPDLVAPGVGLVTIDGGGEADAGYATLTGTSAAAAVVAGAAALVAEDRPDLDAAALAGALVAGAQTLPEEPRTAQGAGLVDASAAARAVVAAEPATLALGVLRPGASTKATLALRNVTHRRVRVRLTLEVEDGAPRSFSVEPQTLTLGPGERRDLTVAIAAGDRAGALSGAIVARSRGRELARIPWLATVSARRPRLVRILDLAPATVSKRTPAVLTFSAGRVNEGSEGLSIAPVALLEVELLNANRKRIGLLARLRDLLPGSYTIALTGRSPTGSKLKAGTYVVRLRAHSADSGEGIAAYTSSASVTFRVRRP